MVDATTSTTIMSIAASGLKAQQSRMRIIAENLANSDSTAFKLEYQPGHPAADKNGYVKLPNVDPLVEAMDMREAQRAYEANLNVIDTARTMQMRTLDLLKQ